MARKLFVVMNAQPKGDFAIFRRQQKNCTATETCNYTKEEYTAKRNTTINHLAAVDTTDFAHNNH